MLALVAINTAFLALDLAAHGPSLALLAGRLIVSAALLHFWWIAGRATGAAWLSRLLTLDGGLVVAGFGLLAAGTGGAQSPYLFFAPVVPIVVGIVAPDEQGPPLAAGAVGLLAGLILQPPGVEASWIVFMVVGNGSCTFYGWVAARLYLRMRQRERASALGREQALEDLRRSEARRALSERLASLGRLAAGVAHEINNPLAFVGTNLAFVEEELGGRGERDPEVLAALRESRIGLDRMKRIVQELRGFARGSADGPGPTDAAGALEEACRTLAARLARVAELEVRVAPGLPPALAQRAELVQVLVNLLANAVDAIERGSGGPGRGRVVATVEPEGEGLEVAVCDTGEGLSAEAQAHVFEPFFTTKGPDGTGLGLALSREFVERWGGRIGAANRPEGGARVAVFLRRADGPDGPGRGEAGPAGALAPRGAPAA